jgi:hypothetical protein
MIRIARFLAVDKLPNIPTGGLARAFWGGLAAFLWVWSSGAASAQSLSVLEWNFGTATYSNVANVKHAAVSSSSVTLAPNSGTTLVASGTGNSSDRQMQAGSWNGTETTTLVAGRSSLTPVSASKVLHSTFAISHTSVANWSTMQVMVNCKRGATTDVTKVRAYLTWAEGGVWKTRYSSIATLSGTSMTTVTLPLNSGATAPTVVAGNTFLLELHFWGSTSSTNSVTIDDLKFQVNSLTNSTASGTLWVSTSSGTGGRLEKYDMTALTKTVVGLTSDSSNHTFFDIAWAPNGKLYGIEPNGNVSSVYEINPNTAATTWVGTVTGSHNGMVFNASGTAYISSLGDGNIYTFSTSSLSTGSTTTATLAYDSPAQTPNGGTLTSGGDLAWVGNHLYYAATGGGKFYLYKVASGTSSVTLVGEIKDYNNVPVSGVYGLIGDGYGSIWAQAGPYLYKLSSTTAVAEAVGIAVTSNTVYGGAISTEFRQINLDYGDYSGFGAVSNVVNSNLRIGGQVDGESDISNGNATSDDTTGVDDEDGVTVPASLPRGSSQSLTVNVTNASGAVGYLNAWIDWNRNGVLTDNGDQIATNVNVANNTTNGSVSVPFTVPMTASLGAVGVRVRLSSASSPGATGESISNGETEDYVSTVYCPTITVTPTTLPGGNVGAAYNQVDGFSASGGNVPYSYSATGVPPGLTFNTGSRKLTGTPTAPGTYAIVVTAVDSVGCSGSVTVSFTATCPTITLGPVSPPVATVGSPWTMTLTQTGAAATPVTYVATTPLPAWLSLDSTTGVASGTPPSSSGFSFNIKATDATGCIGSIGYTIYPACPAITVSGALPTPVQRNASYGTRTLAASGGTSPYTWNVVNGSLPAGLVLTSGVTATTATVSGTPTTLQTSSFTIRATDALGCIKDTSYTVVIGCGSLAVSLPSVNATVGTAYAQTATASGGTAPYTFALNSGSLPTWATLTASTGLLAGTPTSTTSATFTLKATDANGCVGVSPSYTITPGTSFDFGDWNGSGAATTTASNLVNGNLRLGATVDTEASVTPDADACADGVDEDGVTLPTMIARGQAVTVPVTVFNNNTVGRHLKSWVDFNNDGTFTDADLASGGERVYNAALPANAALQTVNVGFTVPASASVGTKRGVRFRVTDNAATTPVSSGAAGETEDYVVRLCPQIVICPAVTQLPVATRASAYSVPITALGGSAPYTFSTIAGALPTGLTLHPSTGVLGGTPTTDQTATFTVKATDATGCEVTRSYTVQVVGPGSVVQVVGGSGTNNVPVRAASYRVNGTTTSQSTESSGVSSTTNSVIELLSLTVQEGTANKTLNVANLNGGSVTNVTVPATNSSFGVLLNGTATSIASSGTAGFSASAAQISSNTNLNHYIFDDRGEGEPDNTGEYDIRFSYGFTSEDYIVVQERFGNSHVQLQPLDATGNVIAGSRTVQVRGTHDWNTGYASASYQSGQSYYLTVVRQTLFGTTSPIFGFRLSINGADCKFFGMSDNPFSDNPTNAGVVGDLVWNDVDQDGVKDTGESGISGVLVKLLNAADLTTVTTTVTDGSGNYSFTAVAPGDYRIEFVRPTGYGFSPADAGGNDALDSDADISTGRTAVFTMLPCDSISYLDAGMYGADYGDYNGFALATQTANSIIRIGTLVTDAEAANPANSAATGDDNTGDDEDLTMPSFTVGSATTLAVPMTVTAASLSGSTARVNVFVDWNGDNDVADTNETLTAQTVSASGTFDFSLTPPVGTSAGTKYLRIRAVEGSTHPGFSGTSTLKGEVEDYAIVATCPVINLSALSGALTVGTSYSSSAVASGGTASYGYQVTSGALPTGLLLDTVTGAVTGTPTSAATFTFTITATDANGCPGSRSFSLVVANSPTLSLGNLVWEDFNNDGIKQAGESGLPNANVRLYRSGADNTVNTADDTLLAGPVATPASGAYSFTGLSAGSYFVRVSPPASNFRTGGTPDTADNNEDNDNNGSQPGGVGTSCYSPIIVLTAGGESTADDGDANTNMTVDFGLWGGFTVGNVVWHDADNDGIKDSGEALLPAVTLQLMTPGADLVAGGTDDTVLLTTTTNATGVYNFFVPQTGKFYVRLNPIPGYELPSGVVFGDTGADNDNNGTQPGGIGSFVNSMVFDLQAATEPGSTGTTNVETTIDFGLWSGLSVSGYVWNDANNNGLTDPAGVPGTAPELGIESQALSLYSTGADHAVGGSGGNADALVATTTSLAGGSYAFSRLLPGYYYLRITPGSAYPLASAVVDVADNGELNDNNGAQPGGISTDITSPVFQLSALTEPGAVGSTSIENSLWFGLRERPTIDISPPTLVGGQVGLPYTQTVSASGGTAPYAWSVSSGSLPAGLALNPSTGEINGTPTVAGTAFFTVQARDAQQVTGTRSYSLTIYQIEISPPVLPVAYRDQPFSQGLTASGGTEPYTWSVLSGALPPGVTLNPAGGLLSGTPTATGTYAFTVKVLDANDFYGTRAYTLTVLGTLGLGNLVFEDLDGNGFYDPGEGIDGVRVELYRSNQVAGVDEPLDFLVTANGGKYVFTDIPPGVYVVHIPAAQFGPSGLLRGLFSLPDVQEGDDDAGEDGVDSAAPQTTGITSTPVTLAMDSLPTDEEGETGFDHESDNSSEAGDAGVDLTLDLGFYRRVSVGNLVFVDGNGNGVANNGEGVANVTVQVYRVVAAGQDEQLIFVKDTVTDAGGRYLIADLQPGLYRVHIPKEMFLPGAALEAKVSIAPGQFGDDDVGEDGLNDTDPVTEGVWTNEVYLQASLAPTNNNGETGTDYTTDDDIDAAVDLTVDFGFQSPAIIGNLVFVDTNNNGHYDPGEGVDGVVLDIYVSGAAVGSLPAATVTTADGGHYLFGNLSGGSYFINVRASNFIGENSPLAGKVSLLGASAAGSDDSVGEDGLDNPSPQNGGISSAEFLVQAGSLPVDSAVGAAMGENGFQADDDNGNSQDANGDMTIDFGFRPVDNTKMAVGNLVFNDLDGDGVYDDGEGVDGVLMELHRASDDLLLASTFTGNGGLYTFSNLDPGDYYLVVAASNFQGTGKLAGKVPMAGQGGDVGIDDDADENGDDPVDPSITGVRSVDFTLAAGTEPTDFDTELGAATYLDALIDANSDLTFDFGFYPVGGIGNLVFADLNKNGKADTGEGIGGVTVRLFAAGADPLNPETPVVAETITDSTAGYEGFYLFTNLPPGDYFAHIPGTMFEIGAPLFGKTSMAGVESGLKDDHQGENGLDSSAVMEQGVSTAFTQLRPGSEPFGTQEAGLYGGEDNGLGDKLYDMTLDFGFVRSPAVGNLVFEDVNRDGVFTQGLDQGIDGVTVELYTTDANPVLKASTVTANGGRYLLSAPAGSYTIKIPAAMFEVSAPLYNKQGTLAGVPGDDDAGQDAIDSADRLVQGVRTVAFTLAEGTMPTAANGETGHDKDSDSGSDADTNLTIDLGFHPLPLGIGNLVFNDVNGNGLFDTGDTGIAGVAVKLFLFGDDPLTAPAVASAETDTGGFYRLNAYVQDNYFVHIAKENFAVEGPLAGLVSTPGASLDSDDDDANENGVDATSLESSGISSGLISLIYGAQPEDAFTESGAGADADNEADANADLTVDFGFRLPSGAPLAGMVRRDLNNDGVATAADAPLQSVEVALYEDGNANGQLDTAEMSAVAATTSDIAGAYVFSDVVAGNYLVVASPLPGATAESDTDGGLPDQTQVTLNAAPVTDVDFLQSLAPETFAGWQREHPLDGSNRPGDNPDNDGSSNLLEYALGTDPASGVVKLPGFELFATERIDAVLRRPAVGQADLRFLIQGSVDGSAWSNLDLTPKASTEDGIETRRYTAVADAALFAGQGMGYVRLRVELDADQNGAPEAVAFTPVQAFSLQSLPLGQTTLSMPLLKPEIFIGGAVVGGARTLLLDRGEGLLPVMNSGSAYEVQWLDGASVGDCFEIDVLASTAGSLVLRTDLPAGLGAGRVAVRPVSTLREVVPPALLQSGSTASAADRVLFFENGAYRVHWLAAAKDGPHWVTDATLADSGGRRLLHQEGFLVHLLHAPVVIPLAGQVPVSAPVLTVALGTRLVGSGGLSAVNPKAVAGDRLRGWSGDATPGTSSFISYTYGATGWISDATRQPSGTPPLLNPFRAVFTVKGP